MIYITQKLISQRTNTQLKLSGQFIKIDSLKLVIHTNSLDVAIVAATKDSNGCVHTIFTLRNKNLRRYALT